MSMSISTRSDRLLLIFTLGALTALGPLAIDLYLPALPAIARSMNEPLSRIQYSLSAYTIAFAVSQLAYGPLSDRFGRRAVMFPGLLGYIITSVLAAMCTTATELVVVRVLQAMSAAAIMVTIPAMIRDLFPKEQVARMLSSILLVMTVAPLLAPVLGGQILLYFNWESLFVFLALLACALMVLAVLRVKETLPEDCRLVVPPLELIMTYKKILSNREAMGCILCHAFFVGGMFAFIGGSPFVYIEYFGVPAEQYGLLFGANIIAMAIANMLNMRLLGNFEVYTILRMGCILAGIAAIALLFDAVTGFGGLTGIVIPVVLFIGCMGFTGPNSNALALGHFPKNRRNCQRPGWGITFPQSGVLPLLWWGSCITVRCCLWSW